MAKNGKNKKRCEKYRNSGHKEINKKLRQERHQKRLAFFAKRRADGKPNANATSHNIVGNDANTNLTEKDSIVYSRRPKQLPLSWWTGIMRQTKNYLDGEAHAMKKQAEMFTNKRNKRSTSSDDEE